MRISARNQIKGTVIEVKKGATTSHVRVDIGGGQIVTSSITNEAVDDLGHQGQGPGYRGDKSLRRHDRGGLIMRAPLLIALVLLGTGSCLCGGRAERLRQVQMEHRPERAALTAPDRIKLASGGDLAALPSTGMTLALRTPRRGTTALAARTRAEGRHLCRFCQYSRAAPKAGLYTVSLSAGGWVDLVQDGHFLKPKAFSGATDCDGIRKTMKYELSASPFVLQVSGTRRDVGLDRDPAVRIGPRPGAFTRKVLSLLLFLLGDIPIGRKSREPAERRFRLSLFIVNQRLICACP